MSMKFIIHRVLRGGARVLLFSFLIFYAYIVQAGTFSPIVPSCESITQGFITVTDVCKFCDFSRLIQSILNFVWYELTAPLAALMLAYAGFLMIVPGRGGGSTAAYARGKKAAALVGKGILIIFLAWLGIDTLMKGLLYNDQSYGPWNEIVCKILPPSIHPLPTRYACGIDLTTGNQGCAPTTNQDSIATWSSLELCQSFCPSGPPAPFIMLGGKIICSSGKPGAELSWQAMNNTGDTSFFMYQDSVKLSTQINATTWSSLLLDFNATYTWQVQGVQSSLKSNVLTLTTPSSCVAPPPPQACTAQALSQKYGTSPVLQDAPDLIRLMTCISNSRNLKGKNLGSVATYQSTGNTLCNMTRGDRTNACTTNCVHKLNSCHYGGSTGSQGALAVDYGNEAIGSDIINAAKACGSAYTGCENNGGEPKPCNEATHVHVSASSCK